MLSSIDSGELSIGGTALRTVGFPSLTTLSDRLYIDSPLLTSMSGLSRLEEGRQYPHLGLPEPALLRHLHLRRWPVQRS